MIDAELRGFDLADTINLDRIRQRRARGLRDAVMAPVRPGDGEGRQVDRAAVPGDDVRGEVVPARRVGPEWGDLAD